jgi:small subunit ribosomal protein S11
MAVSASSAKIKRRLIPVAVVHINATFNNTIITVTDTQGATISWGSAGHVGFKGSRKSTPYAGQMSAEKAMNEAVKYGIKTLTIEVKGVGAGRESALRAVGTVAEQNQIAVTAVKDVTPVPHNGCRMPKRRRV